MCTHHICMLMSLDHQLAAYLWVQLLHAPDSSVSIAGLSKAARSLLMGQPGFVMALQPPPVCCLAHDHNVGVLALMIRHWCPSNSSTGSQSLPTHLPV